MRNLTGIIAGALVIAGITGLVFFTSGGSDARERQLDRSVIGMNALTPWLRSHDIAAQQSRARSRVTPEDVSLRILPLYDTDLMEYAVAPETPREAYYQTTLRDVNYYDVDERINQVASIVLLPKWVGGTRVSAVSHESGLIPASEINRLTGQLIVTQAVKIKRAAPGFTTGVVNGRDLALFDAQLFDPTSIGDLCSAVIAVDAGVLVIKCVVSNGLPVWIVSDPDLFNNHGLTLAQNGAVAADFVKLAMTAGAVTDDRRHEMNRQNSSDSAPAPAPLEQFVYVDLSDYNLVYPLDPEREDYERSSSDFWRYFTPPFTGLWAVLLIVLAISFWRGNRRFGPVRPERDDTPEQSKHAAIATNARLLRIAGHDDRMVADFVQATLHDIARRTFGRQGATLPRLYTWLARRDSDAASRLETLATRLITNTPPMSAPERARSLDTFRSLLETLNHGNDADRLPTAR